jgi:tRNA uridine 5-carboxymethylaminomethyl modification enzyme
MSDKNKFDIIVVGAGHAGCEAALASARLNNKTLLLTLNLESVALLACNPSIGGTAKGHIVREIDALGGEMGINTDGTLIQLKMLNVGKGPAVHSLRAQADKYQYHFKMKSVLENTPALTLKQAEAQEIIVEDGKVVGVGTTFGDTYAARAVVLATGVYLKSRVIMGKFSQNIGPNGFAAANYLTDSLIKNGLEIRRFKTGTPARINSRSVDYSLMDVQNGDGDISPFSFMSESLEALGRPNIACYLTYTNLQTHKIIKDNLSKAPLYSGGIKGVGPRYCPSIEDKVIRFADKERHQIFLEPEGLCTNEVYVQGMSTSFDADTQQKIYKSIRGLENAEIMRNAYAIEYDCINPQQLFPTLQVKHIKGLYTAGQINGTSGYEEAAAQGLVAGINAANFCKGKKPFTLSRAQAYIGVLIDDIINKGVQEPYRMMTSRAEHRLYLRQDNADLRLTELGYKLGLATKERFERFRRKQSILKKCEKELDKTLSPDARLVQLFEQRGESLRGGISIREALKRTNISCADLAAAGVLTGVFEEADAQILKQLEIAVKYEGYLSKQELAIRQAKKAEQKPIPPDLDYGKINGLRIEAKQKLNLVKPLNIGQAGRISGVNPADVAVLIVYLSRFSYEKKSD